MERVLMARSKESLLGRLAAPKAPTSLPRTIVRLVMGGFLAFAGVAHLTFARADFAAQVPGALPVEPDLVVGSGVAEIALGGALVVLPRRRVAVGWVVAVFFVAVFPGNVSQWLNARDGFGLDTDSKRFVRLFFQPLLILAALWSTAAWRDRPRRSR